jgi:hypothetical protein
VTQSLADLFVTDPLAAVLHVLQTAGTPLSAAEIKNALAAGGVAKVDADKTWPTVQKRVKAEPDVTVENNRYGWAGHPAESPLGAVEAFELIVKGRLPAPEKAALVEIVRAALKEADHSAPDPREVAARQRQAEVDGVRTLGELAGEVEELIVNEVEPEAVIRRVRARVKRQGLEPIGRAGEQTRFDRKSHTPIGGAIRDGARVIVVRPGYVWTHDGADLLIGKAVVEE